MKLKKPFNGLNVNLKVAPGEEKIALIRIKDKVGGLGFSQSVNFV